MKFLYKHFHKTRQPIPGFLCKFLEKFFYFILRYYSGFIQDKVAKNNSCRPGGLFSFTGGRGISGAFKEPACGSFYSGYFQRIRLRCNHGNCARFQFCRRGSFYVVCRSSFNHIPGSGPGDKKDGDGIIHHSAYRGDPECFFQNLGP